jgi:Leucine-rich repeat (LRR) protein
MARINDTPELDPVLFPNISVAGFLQHYVEDRIENTLAAEAGKQPAGTGTTEKGTQPAAQKRTRTTKHDTQTQPLLLAADAFDAAPAAEPDWCTLWEPILQNTNEQGIWPADRTIMLRRTSKRVKEVVDKMRLPAVVRLRRSFWDDARNGTEKAKLEFVLRQLAAMTVRCLITTLELPECEMKGQDAERLAGVLGQCRELVHLNLSDNQIGPDGAERLAGVLAQCPALAHLDLCGNQIGPTGADSLAGVLGQCAALSHLDLSCNDMGSNPPRNRSGGAEKLAGVLGQCTALAHLDISWNQIGDRDGQKLARVITECPALTYLNLRGNCFTSPPTRGRLRALWCGESCGDLFYKGKMEQKQMERDLEALKKLGRERGWSSAKKPADGSSKKKVANNANRIMTFEEKRTMSLNINKSPHDKLGKVVEIIKKPAPTSSTTARKLKSTLTYSTTPP